LIPIFGPGPWMSLGREYSESVILKRKLILDLDRRAKQRMHRTLSFHDAALRWSWLRAEILGSCSLLRLCLTTKSTRLTTVVLSNRSARSLRPTRSRRKSPVVATGQIHRCPLSPRPSKLIRASHAPGLDSYLIALSDLHQDSLFEVLSASPLQHWDERRAATRSTWKWALGNYRKDRRHIRRQASYD